MVSNRGCDVWLSRRARYQGGTGHRAPKSADATVGAISGRFIRVSVGGLSLDLAPASVHKTVGVLGHVLTTAVDDNRLAMNPLSGVELPSVLAAEKHSNKLGQPHALTDGAGTYRRLVCVLGTYGPRIG